MRILIPTDAFPPVCGGSGWSTYELARGLRSRGHEVTIVQPRPGTPTGARDTEYDGFRVRELGAPAPDIPYVRNYYKSEKLTRSLREYLTTILRTGGYDIVHAQHVMTTMAAIDAAHAAHLPAVATVRDYWPVCYWSDLLHTREGLALCPACTAGNMTVCIRPRAGSLWPLALPLIPYMRANLAAKREGLARADAVIAVSRRIAQDLVARAPELSRTRIEVIPNAVNVEALQMIARREARGARRGEVTESEREARGARHEEVTESEREARGARHEEVTESEREARGARREEATAPYALYLGKLAPNKGTGYLVDVVRRADLDWPLIVAGDGPDRAALERAAAASGRRIEFRGWVDKDEAARLLARASMLIFPSRGPESLSRVLLEASALGIPIAAMDTGGTRDIIDHNVTGLLSATPEGLAGDVRRLRQDPSLRRRLGDAASRKMAREFDTAAVVARVEHLYQDLVERRSR